MEKAVVSIVSEDLMLSAVVVALGISVKGGALYRDQSGMFNRSPQQAHCGAV